MSKKAFRAYLKTTPKKELEAQLLLMYERFPAVKQYYNFIFNPREEELVDSAKARIRKEYFPTNGRKPKARRSVAQRLIREFRTLEMEPFWVAEVMVFNLETAGEFERTRKQPLSFYKSLLTSFEEAASYIVYQGMGTEFGKRMGKIYQRIREGDWPLQDSFSQALERFE